MIHISSNNTQNTKTFNFGTQYLCVLCCFCAQSIQSKLMRFSNKHKKHTNTDKYPNFVLLINFTPLQIFVHVSFFQFRSIQSMFFFLCHVFYFQSCVSCFMSLDFLFLIVSHATFQWFVVLSHSYLLLLVPICLIKPHSHGISIITRDHPKRNAASMARMRSQKAA